MLQGAGGLHREGGMRGCRQESRGPRGVAERVGDQRGRGGLLFRGAAE